MNNYNNFGFGNSSKNIERVIFVNMAQTKYALDIKDSIDRTKVYDSSELIYPERGSLQTEFVFEQTDSVSAVFKYADKDTAILNFANFTTNLLVFPCSFEEPSLLPALSIPDNQMSADRTSYCLSVYREQMSL